MNFRYVFRSLAAFLLVAATPVAAAVGTTCVCRSDKGDKFEERTLRHHRWTCDYRIGYTKGDPAINLKPRPATQTCNKEEIVQFKVYLCVSSGCTYPYAASTVTPNKDVEKIAPMEGKRRP